MEKKILLFLFPLFHVVVGKRDGRTDRVPQREEKSRNLLSLIRMDYSARSFCLSPYVCLSVYLSMCLVSGRGSSHLLPFFSLSVRMPGSLTSSSRNLHISPYDDEGSSHSLRSITRQICKRQFPMVMVVVVRRIFLPLFHSFSFLWKEPNRSKEEIWSVHPSVNGYMKDYYYHRII